MSLDEGSVFAGFTIVRLLGSGGMGDVYLAEHPDRPGPQALRILPAEVSADPQFRERLDQEAALAASLSHPHIVGVLDHGECDGRFWISTDYVEGTDCAQLLSQQQAGLPRDQVIDITGAVAGALDYAHERGLQHRDVRPANILLVGDDRRIMLADFGIARPVDDDSDVEGRADQYALAATARELLYGAKPVGDASPADLDPAISRALADGPDDRFATCQEFAEALRAGAQTDETAIAAAEPTVAEPIPTVTEPIPTVADPVPTVAAPVQAPAPTVPVMIAPVPAPPAALAAPAPGSSRNRTLLVLIPIAVLLLAIVAVTVVLLTRHTAPKVSQEDRVRTAIRQFDTAIQKGDLATLRNITCGATRDGYLHYNDEAWATAYQRTQIAKQYPVIDTIDEVAVNGQHAEANVTTYMAYDPQVRSTRSLDLQLLDGEWKVCQAPGR